MISPARPYSPHVNNHLGTRFSLRRPLMRNVYAVRVPPREFYDKTDSSRPAINGGGVTRRHARERAKRTSWSQTAIVVTTWPSMRGRRDMPKLFFRCPDFGGEERREEDPLARIVAATSKHRRRDHQRTFRSSSSKSRGESRSQRA